MNDLIDEIYDEADELSQFQNVSQVKARGLELGLKAQFKMGLSAYANYIFQRSEDGDTEEKLTNSPSHLLKTGLLVPVLDYFYATVTMQYETGRITVYETETDSYLLTNVSLSTKPVFDRIRLSMQVRNLFDETYRLPGGYEHFQDAITQNGRNFEVRLDYKF